MSAQESDSARPLSLLQITLVVSDLESTIRDFEKALGLRVAFRDPGVALWGLENAVLPMGTTFIELMTPKHAETAGARHLDRQGGDGGYMVILQTDALDPWRAPLAERKVRIAWEGSTKDVEHGFEWAGLHLHPKDTGGMIISLDRPDPPDSWAGAGPHWRDFIVQDVVDGLSGIEVRGLDAARLSSRWAETLGRPLDGDARIRLDQGWVAFGSASSAAQEGLSRVSLHAVDRTKVGESFLLGRVPFQLV